DSEPRTKRLRLRYLGIEVTPMRATDVIDWIDSRNSKSLLLNHNLHSTYLHADSDRFRQLYSRADRIIIDGAPILWMAQRAQPGALNSEFRIGSTDWIARLNQSAS